VELQKEVKDIGIDDNSLQKIYANLFGGRISKNQQLSNWEADILTEAQQRYAATDAWACIKIHEEVARMKQSGDFVVEKTTIQK
jgi:ribonuclease D